MCIVIHIYAFVKLFFQWRMEMFPLIPRYEIPQLSLGDECELKSREVALFKEPPAPAGGCSTYRFQKDIRILNWHYDLNPALLNIS